jgi:hypothetical protein
MAVSDPEFVVPFFLKRMKADRQPPGSSRPFAVLLGSARRSRPIQAPKSGGYTGKSPEIKAFRPLRPCVKFLSPARGKGQERGLRRLSVAPLSQPLPQAGERSLTRTELCSKERRGNGS